METLSSALPQDCTTVRVFETPKDPDNVALFLLATDDEEEDAALQIHFNLIQAFCCENDTNILRSGNTRRLVEILGVVEPAGEPVNLLCDLITNPQSTLWKNSRCLDQWVPLINLPGRCKCLDFINTLYAFEDFFFLLFFGKDPREFSRVCGGEMKNPRKTQLRVISQAKQGFEISKVWLCHFVKKESFLRNLVHMASSANVVVTVHSRRWRWHQLLLSLKMSQ